MALKEKKNILQLMRSYIVDRSGEREHRAALPSQEEWIVQFLLIFFFLSKKLF